MTNSRVIGHLFTTQNGKHALFNGITSEFVLFRVSLMYQTGKLLYRFEFFYLVAYLSSYLEKAIKAL